MPTYTIRPIRSVFTRKGYELRILNDDGTPFVRLLDIEGHPRLKFPDSSPIYFYGDDGRKVRAEAIAEARRHGAVPYRPPGAPTAAQQNAKHQRAYRARQRAAGRVRQWVEPPPLADLRSGEGTDLLAPAAIPR